MPGSTTPLNFPYPVDSDSLETAVRDLPRQLAERVNDALAALGAMAPAPPTTQAGITGWSGGIAYARRAGMVTVALDLSRPNFGAGDAILQLPGGFTPVFAVRGLGQFAAVGGSPQLRPFKIETNGVMIVDGQGSYTGGIFGSVTYPV